MANKTIRLCFRVTESEYQIIKDKALKANMNISGYLTAAALDKRIVVVEELKSVLPQLRKVGVNLNQLTVLCHQGKITCPDLSSVQKELNSIWRLLTSLTDKTKP